MFPMEDGMDEELADWVTIPSKRGMFPIQLNQN